MNAKPASYRVLRMKTSHLKWMQRGILAAGIGVLATLPLHAELLEKTVKVSAVSIQYKVVLPNGYDPAKADPAILAFGGGPQDMNRKDAMRYGEPGR